MRVGEGKGAAVVFIGEVRCSAVCEQAMHCLGQGPPLQGQGGAQGLQSEVGGEKVEEKGGDLL